PPVDVDGLAVCAGLDVATGWGTKVATHPIVNHRIRDEPMVDDDGRQLRMAEVGRVHEDELIDHDLGAEGCQRCPSDEPVAPEPVDPRRPPDRAGYPDPAECRNEAPPSIVERPRPRLGGDPGPAIGRPRPVPIDVRPPSVGDPGAPHLSVVPAVRPPTEG